MIDLLCPLMYLSLLLSLEWSNWKEQGKADGLPLHASLSPPFAEENVDLIKIDPPFHIAFVSYVSCESACVRAAEMLAETKKKTRTQPCFFAGLFFLCARVCM